MNNSSFILHPSSFSKAPFPWFGGKRRCAHLVWPRLGNPNYLIDPFFGSGAMLWARPHEPRVEIVNDKDRYLSNFWRAVQANPALTAHYADWPINETDLHAHHTWLVNEGAKRLEPLDTDPHYYDPQVAGYWVWGISQWIGNGWCVALDRRRPHITYDMGVHTTGKKRPMLWREGGGVHKKSIQGRLPDLRGNGKGIHQKRPDLYHAARGVFTRTDELYAWFDWLSLRLRRVKVCSGDWRRVLTHGATCDKKAKYGIFLDPPYGVAERKDMLYREDSMQIAGQVHHWAVENDSRPNLRIALCGHDGEHNALEERGWTKTAWTGGGGYGNMHNNRRPNKNRKKERIWFSPHCLDPEPEK